MMDETGTVAAVSGGLPGQSWGDYRLGDLADVLQSTARVVGQSVRVVRLTVFSPLDGDPWPVVQLAVETRHDLDLARKMLELAGFVPVPDVDDMTRHNFGAAMDGVVVHVWVKD
jgi:hypothetical protein